jgi:hypothetical protein
MEFLTVEAATVAGGKISMATIGVKGRRDHQGVR